MYKIIIAMFLFNSLHKDGMQQGGLSDMEVLKALNATFIHNYVTSDTESHNKILHKDFVYISSNGQYVNRKEYLAGWADGFKGIVYWDYRDERINIFGSMALVHATNKFIMLEDGKEISGMAMYTDVYVKENNEWKCVQAQIGKVLPEFYPGDETIVRKYDYRK